MEKSLLKDLITEMVKDSLKESFKPNVTVKLNNNQEVQFSSPEHAQFLQQLLGSLEQVRNYYKKGSANRHVYSVSVTKLKRLIKNITNAQNLQK